jgi:glyoxylase-like metal-dependent hydrolase (beta-lactamase superfamily II)
VAFLTEPAPAYGTPEYVAPGVRRLVAPNPGPMTYHGTNTWLVDGPDGVTVIDPGPDDAGHIAAILAAGQGARPISHILLTHTHPDHVDGAPALQAATGAATYGWGRPWHASFRPDHALADGESVAGLTALHTPGHASDHLCFVWRDGVVFTGDHVMSWNTSIVSPPDGDMAAYMDGLRLLLARDDRLYLCGHGAPLPEPQALVRAMLNHRVGRESAVLGALGGEPVTSMAIVEQLYAGLDDRLKKAADRTVIAHLHKLVDEGRAVAMADRYVKAG